MMNLSELKSLHLPVTDLAHVIHEIDIHRKVWEAIIAVRLEKKARREKWYEPKTKENEIQQKQSPESGHSV